MITILEGHTTYTSHFAIQHFFKKSVVNMSIKVYNTLPDSINTLNSFKVFKSKLKLFLLDHPFYLMNEFYSLK
jgi:hypothetical protein